MPDADDPSVKKENTAEVRHCYATVEGKRCENPPLADSNYCEKHRKSGGGGGGGSGWGSGGGRGSLSGKVYYHNTK